MYKIFVIEDDKIIAEGIKNCLEKWGMEVKIAENFNQIIQEFINYQPQLVFMDITLPFYNGYHWCSEIRKISKVPIIFISSASDKMNMLMAMNMGADDFVSKPFDTDILLAKVQAMLRRTYSFQSQTELLECRGVILNISDASLSYNNIKLELTKNDFRILNILFENINKTVSREMIMKKLWDSDCFIDDNTLTVNITRLRKKLEEIGVKDFIITKKGIGYMIGE